MFSTQVCLIPHFGGEVRKIFLCREHIVEAGYIMADRKEKKREVGTDSYPLKEFSDTRRCWQSGAKEYHKVPPCNKPHTRGLLGRNTEWQLPWTGTVATWVEGWAIYRVSAVSQWKYCHFKNVIWKIKGKKSASGSTPFWNAVLGKHYPLGLTEYPLLCSVLGAILFYYTASYLCNLGCGLNFSLFFFFFLLFLSNLAMPLLVS